MAIVLTKEPREVVWSRNPVLFVFRSDAKYSNLGRVYKGNLRFANGMGQGVSFKLSFGGDEYDFVFRNSPDTSGLQLPAWQSGQAVESWMGDVVLALRGNYYLSKYYDISQSGTDIRMEGRTEDAEYSITMESSQPGLTIQHLQTAMSKTVQPNFNILAELWVQDESGNDYVQHSTSALDTDDRGIAMWDVSEQLSSALLSAGHDRPDMANPTYELSRKTVRKWYIRYAEMYGARQTVKKVYQSMERVAALGGWSKGMMAERLFPDWFVVGGLLKWLQQTDNYRVLKENQPDYLYAINFVQDRSNVQVVYRIHYSDNSTIEYIGHTFASWKKWEKLIVPIGMMQVGLKLVDEEKVIAGYDIELRAGGAAITESLRVTINYKYEPYSRFLLYENSMGAYEGVYVYGRKSKGYEVVQEHAEILRNHVFELRDGERIDFDIRLTDEEVVNTGYMTKRQVRNFRDFFLSRDKFAYKNGRYYPISLTSNKITEFEDGKNLFALGFAIGSRYSDELWTADEETDEHGYTPDLSGYIPQPPLDPPNFDDRYYLKTQVYNKSEIDNLLQALQVSVDNSLTLVNNRLDDVNISLANKSNVGHTHPEYADIDDIMDMISMVRAWYGEWSPLDPTEDEEGYLSDMYVVHKGAVYVSLTDNNYEEPGTGDDWRILMKGVEHTVIDVNAGVQEYTLQWDNELREKHGTKPREPEILVKAGNDPPDTWTVLRSTVKYVLDGNGMLTSMKITLSGLQAKIIIR